MFCPYVFRYSLGVSVCKWWAVTDLNRGPSRCKRDALTAELTALPDSTENFLQLIQITITWFQLQVSPTSQSESKTAITLPIAQLFREQMTL